MGIVIKYHLGFVQHFSPKEVKSLNRGQFVTSHFNQFSLPGYSKFLKRKKAEGRTKTICMVEFEVLLPYGSTVFL